MNLPSASPNENMQTAASIRPMPARRAERSSVVAGILASKFISTGTPHAEERPLGRVSKDEASWFETAQTLLLTMRSGLRQSASSPASFRDAPQSADGTDITGIG